MPVLVERRRVRLVGSRQGLGPNGRGMVASLRRAYTLWAPFYDVAVAASLADSRRASLAAMGDVSGQRILLVGVGTGLDVPWLRPGAAYVGLDLTPAMLRRAREKSRRYGIPTALSVGDAMKLPFREAAFDRVVLHLILAVVPDAVAALREAARVVRPGGTIHILDKFLRPGQYAPVRRWLSPLLGRLATHTDVVFEDVSAACPGVSVVSDEPDLARGWFRRIVLKRPR
ncbi:MAG: class I SAM-dependent methyltransferase [Nitrospirota bacterium]